MTVLQMSFTQTNLKYYKKPSFSTSRINLGKIPANRTGDEADVTQGIAEANSKQSKRSTVVLSAEILGEPLDGSFSSSETDQKVLM